jgi:hypothetical protein
MFLDPQDFLPEVYDMYNPGVKAVSDAYSAATGGREQDFCTVNLMLMCNGVMSKCVVLQSEVNALLSTTTHTHTHLHAMPKDYMRCNCTCWYILSHNMPAIRRHEPHGSGI